MDGFQFLEGRVALLVSCSVLILSLGLYYVSRSRSEKGVFLTKERKKMLLVGKRRLSPDTFLFTFSLGGRVLGLPIGKHVKFVCPPPSCRVVGGEWNGRVDEEVDEVQRKYTPVSGNEKEGFVDFVVKVYLGGVLAKFVDGGKMSQHLDSLRVGKDSIDVEGPVGLIEYTGEGQFVYAGRKMLKRKIGMIAGGTGITPMLQIAKAVRDEHNQSLEISLIFANQSEDDILLKEELLQLQQEFNCKVWFTVDKAGPDWKYDVGYVNGDMIKSHLPSPGEETLILLCGPPPMLKFACLPALQSLGYQQTDILQF